MGFLGRAKKMMRGQAPAEPPRPQYYSVACPEGHVVRGQRTDGYQAIRCPSCGEGIFVLPRSPLPQPTAPAGRARPKPVPVAALPDDEPIALAEAPPQPSGRGWDEDEDHDEPIGEIEWLEPEPTAAATSPAKRPAPAPEPDSELEAPTAPTPAPAKPARPRPAAARPAAQEATAPTDAPSRPKAPAKKAPKPKVVEVAAPPRKRPVHLYILVGVVGLVVATVGYRVWRQRLQDLPHEAEINRDEGIAALERGDVDDAKRRLARAVEAYRALGVTDEVAQSTRQAADEAAILADLDSHSLKEIVEEVARLGEPEGPAWFDLNHKGRTIFYEEEFSDAPRVTKAGAIEPEYRIFVGRSLTPAKQGRLDLQGFRLLEGQAFKKGDILRFGAKLRSIRLEGNLWLIDLEPDSGVTMTNEKALQAMHIGRIGEGG